MATLENRVIFLGSFTIPLTNKKIDYYHHYTIHTRDNGEQWVLRSGPSESLSDGVDPISNLLQDLPGSASNNYGNIKFTYEKYKNSDGSPVYSVVFGQIVFAPDLDSDGTNYDSRLHLTSGPILTGTDSEIDLEVASRVAKGNEINAEQYPYSPAHQNSNTANTYANGYNANFYDNLEYKPIEGTGASADSLPIRQRIEQNGGKISGSDIFAPAIGEDFEHHVNISTVAWDLVENSFQWLYEHTGKPLYDFITESGSTILDWTINLAESIGQDVVDMWDSASDFFTNLFSPDNNSNIDLSLNQEDPFYVESRQLVLGGDGFINNDIPVNELPIQHNGVEHIQVDISDVDDLADYLESLDYRNITSATNNDYSLAVEEYERLMRNVNEDFADLQENFIEDFYQEFEIFREENSNWVNEFDSFKAGFDGDWERQFDGFVADWRDSLNDLADDLVYTQSDVIYYDPDSIEYSGISADLKSEYQDIIDWELDFVGFDDGQMIGNGYYEEEEMWRSSMENYDWSEYDANFDGNIDIDEYENIAFDEIAQNVYEQIASGISYDISGYYSDGAIELGEMVADGWWESGYEYIGETYDLQDYWDITVESVNGNLLSQYRDIDNWELNFIGFEDGTFWGQGYYEEIAVWDASFSDYDWSDYDYNHDELIDEDEYWDIDFRSIAGDIYDDIIDNLEYDEWFEEWTTSSRWSDFAYIAQDYGEWGYDDFWFESDAINDIEDVISYGWWENGYKFVDEQYDLEEYWNIEVDEISAESTTGYDVEWNLDFVGFEDGTFWGHGYYEETEFWSSNYEDYYWSDFDYSGDGRINDEEFQNIDFNNIAEYIFYSEIEPILGYSPFSWFNDGAFDIEGMVNDGYFEDGYKFVDENYNLGDYWDNISFDIDLETYQLDYDWFFDGNWDMEMSWIDNSYWDDNNFSFDIDFNYSGLDDEELQNFLDSIDQLIYDYQNGSSNNDIITGADVNDIINSGAGDDIINAGAGIDIINSGAGNDTISGGAGSDIFIISAGNNSTTITDFEFDNPNERIDLSAFNTIQSIDELNISEGLASIYLDNGQIINITNATKDDLKDENFIFAPNHNPTSILNEIGTNEDNTIIIDPLASAMDIDDDSLSITNITQAQNGIASIITNEQTGYQTISYSPSANYFGGDNFDYTISDGNGGFVTKTITINVASVNDAPVVNATISNQSALAGNNFSFTIPANIFSDIDNETLTYNATLSNGNVLPTWISFNATSKTFTGTSPSGVSNTLSLSVIASDGTLSATQNFNFNISSNLISGTTGNNSLIGTNNNDVIDGGIGSDLLDGGAGDDTLIYSQDGTASAGFVALNVGSPDAVDWSGERITIAPRKENYDGFEGGDGTDTIQMGSGNEALFLDDRYHNNPFGNGLGTARIRNVEIINAGSGDDIIDLTSDQFAYGNVTLNGDDGDDVLWSSSGNDIINGGNGADNIDGGTGVDILNGGDGNDKIHGKGGNDIIIGGLGQDNLTGGSGNDIFKFTSFQDSRINASDLIADFNQNQDKINFTDLNLTDHIVEFGSNPNDTPAEGISYYHDAQNNTVIQYNDVANDNNDFAIKLTGKINFVGSEFEW